MNPTKEREALEQIWETVLKLTQLLGSAPLNKHPECWYYAVDASWEIAINGHNESKTCASFRNWPAIDVPPFSIYVEYHGWPAGVIGIYEASIAAGDAANIFTFRDSLVGELERLGS